MNLKEYLKIKIKPDTQLDLELIYQELRNLGHPYIDIYCTINEIIIENINKILEDYYKKKNENQ